MKLTRYIHIPRRFDSPSSRSLDACIDGRICQALQSIKAQLQTSSGARLIEEADDALRTRLRLIQDAEQTLDLQYYKWLQDNSGTLLLSHLIAAADRGVRVRLLIDDIHFEGELNAVSLNQHKNIEIRLFNPFEFRRMTPLTRPLEWLTVNRVNHRMHNKLMIADNLIAITGGRNISDRYFGIDTNEVFRDLDLLVAGKAIPGMSQAFDDFWNSRWSVPVDKIIAINLPVTQAKKIRHLFRRFRRSRTYGQQSTLQQVVQQPLPSLTAGLSWVDAQIIYDTPEKVGAINQVGITATILQNMALLAKKNLTLVTPYLVPSPGLMAMLAEVLSRGVRVTILTNSLASNDVAIAHSAYIKLRKQLLIHPVRLYELSRHACFDKENPNIEYMLHTKAMVIDDALLFIGSHNADPRSIHINTEMGLVIKSQHLAARVIQNINRHISNGNAWRVRRFKGKLYWRICRSGQSHLARQEPESRLCRRWLARIATLLPVAHQL